MMQTLFRKSATLGAVALIASALALPASAEGMAMNPCAKSHKARHMKKRQAANPCAAKPANPCAKK